MSKKLIKKCQPGDIIVKSDNTRVASPVIEEKPIYIQPQSKQTYVSADYRSPWQQQQDQKKADIAYNMYIDEKNKELALQHALGLATVADAVMLVPDVTDLITKGIKLVGKKHLQKKVAKEFERAVNERIWRDGRNIEKYGYDPRRIIMGTPVGMPEPDVNTFFHSGNFVSNLPPGTPVPKRGGYVRVKDGQIQPIDGGVGEPRIWWNEGDNYGNGEIILTTKSSKVDERVVDNLDKYDEYHGLYYPSYHTSGAIPLDEVDIYYRNPLTGDYDHPIQYTPTTPKVEGNTSLAFYERPSTLTQAELQGLSRVERTNFGRRPTNWGNLRFFRNLEGLPSIQNGKIIISPQSNMVANVTTDLPFRLHDRYSMLPGREYMMIHPEGLKNFSPINLDPMDTMFPNQGLSVSPEYVTIISGNPEILHEAKKLGMSVQTSPKLQSLYFTADDLTYSKAVDDLITELGRPGIKEYKTLSGITGLDIKVEPYTNQLDVYNKLKHRVRNMSMDELDRTFAPTYQSGVVYPDGTNLGIYDLAFPSVLNDEVIPYQKVFYNPAPMVEQNTMLDLGLHAHPQFISTNPRSVRLYEDLLKLRGKPLRKQGGRLIPKHSKGSPVNNNPLPKWPINTNPVPEVKPKKKKGLQIRSNFKNERPIPGMITFPVVGFKQS